MIASECSLPPSVQGLPVRTTTDGPMPHKEALQVLKDGNKRFVDGETLAGNVTNGMRKALVKEGQAPLAAIIGCADSRAPLETVFDAMPGDIFVLRNAGNTCILACLHVGNGSFFSQSVRPAQCLMSQAPTLRAAWLAAWSFASERLAPRSLADDMPGKSVGFWHVVATCLVPRMVMVLGHTACGAIKGATATHLQMKAGNKPQVTKALDALLQGLSVVASKAADELGPNATEEQIVNHTIKLQLGST